MTDKLREAAQQALYALELNCSSQTESPATKAIHALRAALAQQDAQAVRHDPLPHGWSVVQVTGSTTNVWPMTEAQMAEFAVAALEKESAMLKAYLTPPAQQGTRRLPTLPFAVFDEFGKGCEDRIDDYFSAALAQQDAQKKHKPLFAEMIAQHPGLAEELAQQDAQEVPPANCRQRLKLEGKAYPRSGCAVCGPLSLYQKKCDAMLNAAPTPPAQRVMLTDEEIDEVWNSIAGHSIYAEYQMEIANAMIEAYERKNGIK